MNDRALIDALGGPTKVASSLGLKRSQNVSNWRSRGIPAEHRAAVLVLARANGIALDEAEFLRLPEALRSRGGSAWPIDCSSSSSPSFSVEG